MVKINNINPDLGVVRKTLENLNKEEKEITTQTLHEIALKSDEARSLAYHWVDKNWGHKESDTWTKQHHKNQQAIEEAEAAVVWKGSLTPLQKLGRKVLGEEKELSEKFPHWLVGEKDHPKTEQIKDARYNQIIADSRGNTGLASAWMD
jgi:hypothetical protein